MYNLKGKVALVTGSSRGIGKAIALKLADNGVNIVVNHLRNKTKAHETEKEIKEKGVDCLVVKGNVREEEGVKNIFKTIKETFNRVDIIVSNAASGVLKPVLELKKKHWDWTMDINARALIDIVQQAVPLMHKGGKIIAVSSLGAIRAIPNYTAVGSSKAALESLVRHIAFELAPRGIIANIVSAGAVDTEALKHFPNREEILNNAKELSPVGKLVTPEDIANVVLFLASNLSNMIIGQTIIVDGGYSIRG